MYWNSAHAAASTVRASLMRSRLRRLRSGSALCTSADGCRYTASASGTVRSPRRRSGMRLDRVGDRHVHLVLDLRRAAGRGGAGPLPPQVGRLGLFAIGEAVGLDAARQDLPDARRTAAAGLAHGRPAAAFAIFTKSWTRQYVVTGLAGLLARRRRLAAAGEHRRALPCRRRLLRRGDARGQEQEQHEGAAHAAPPVTAVPEADQGTAALSDRGPSAAPREGAFRRPIGRIARQQTWLTYPHLVTTGGEA